jgi:hypothetical protein
LIRREAAAPKIRHLRRKIAEKGSPPRKGAIAKTAARKNEYWQRSRMETTTREAIG